MKKVALIVLSICLTVTLFACGAKQDSQTAPASSSGPSFITDNAGVKVQIPEKVEKIADAWRAHNEVVAILGGGNKIVATVLKKKGAPWMYKVNPSMNNAISTFGDGFNTEDLVSLKPDVLFTSLGDKNADKISKLGIPVVQLNFTNFNEMKKCISLTAEVMGSDAVKKAKDYNEYLDSKLKMVRDITAKLPADQKPKVLHVESLSPLEVDGSKTIINDWIEAAGGVNAAKDINGNMKEVTMEQVLQWNPDIIILGANGVNGKVPTLKELTGDAKWKNVSAVKNGKVYQNPTGAYLWDRYSPEEVLQVQWAAKTIHPDKFSSLDIEKETKDYYKTFLNYNLTDDDVQRILKSQPPQ